jgi:hypothetical protein
MYTSNFAVYSEILTKHIMYTVWAERRMFECEIWWYVKKTVRL